MESLPIISEFPSIVLITLRYKQLIISYVSKKHLSIERAKVVKLFLFKKIYSSILTLISV